MLGEALIKPNIIARSQLTVGLHATAKQAIQTFGVETQPQATGRKMPNEDNKKRRYHVCTRKWVYLFVMTMQKQLLFVQIVFLNFLN